MEEPVGPGVHGLAVDELDVLEGGGVDVRVVQQEEDRLGAGISSPLDGEDLRVARVDGDHAEPEIGLGLRVPGAPDVEVVERDGFAGDEEPPVVGELDERRIHPFPAEHGLRTRVDVPGAVERPFEEGDRSARG